MERHLRFLLGTALILFTLGISLQTSAQPEVVAQVPANSENFNTVGNLVYFNVGDELWRTDGTAEGTINLKQTVKFFRHSLVSFKGLAIFERNETSDLWRSDGTPEGTFLLGSFGGSGTIQFVGQTKDYVFFQAYEPATGIEMYRTDGTVAGTILIKDLKPGRGFGAPYAAAVLGDVLFFDGDDGVTGHELWKTDGSEEGTTLVKDINPGPDDGIVIDDPFFVSDSSLFFPAYMEDTGNEPWVSDGTSAGTFMVDELIPGPEGYERIWYEIAHDGTVYFSTYLATFSDTERELWKTSGSPGSSEKLKEIGYDVNGYSFRSFNDEVYFITSDEFKSRFWKTDGTSEGTLSWYTLDTQDSDVSFFQEVNDYLLFLGESQGRPTPFFRSDGTAAGTEEFTSFKAYGFYENGIVRRIGVTKVGDLVFYADHDGPIDEGGHALNEEDLFHLFQGDGISTQSMRALYGTNTSGAGNIVDFNGQVLFTTPNDVGENLWIYDPKNPSETSASFTLVDADTDEDLQNITNDEVIRIDEGVDVNIRFNAAGSPGSVVFTLNGAKFRTESQAPYSLAGDSNGDYNGWSGANPGTYSLTATPYSESGGRGTAGTPYSVTFKIEMQDSGPCGASGTIVREYWEDVPGSRVSDIPVNASPSGAEHVDSFEGPANAGSNYGARFRGYICPPATGDYLFWIASNDHSELWLSRDDNPNNKIRIAYVEGSTNPYQWTKFPTQQSGRIRLYAGVRYYIEALHKQGAGTDHAAVGWQLPDGTMERPISGSRLSPFDSETASRPTVTLLSPKEGDTFTAPATVVIEAEIMDVDGMSNSVEFLSNSEIIAEFKEPPYRFVWTDVPEGTYSVVALSRNSDESVSYSAHVNITVGSSCMASGTITREYWGGVQGSQVSDVPVNSPPTSVSELTIFEGPSNVGTHYGSRIRGYICPPETGDYVFFISSNDHSELWLSTDADPVNKVKIAWLTSVTGERQWSKYPSQRSMPIALTQGHRYYIEAVHKQGVGSDHLAVGWQRPGGTFEGPIPGSRLSPFDMNDAARMASAVEDKSEKETMYAQIGIYPNPVERGTAALKMSGYEGISETVETQVEIISLTGEVIYAERIRCGGDCGTYLMNINQELMPGLYMVNLRTNGARFSKRLLVK